MSLKLDQNITPIEEFDYLNQLYMLALISISLINLNFFSAITQSLLIHLSKKLVWYNERKLLCHAYGWINILSFKRNQELHNMLPRHFFVIDLEPSPLLLICK